MKSISSIRLDLEDREFLDAFPEVPMMFGVGSQRPERITVPEFHVRHNQGSMGSCQGHSITSCVERLLTVGRTHKGTQLSRIYAYLASQQIDGLLGADRGSTISAGVKIALKGIPTEDRIPYPSPARYPGSAKRREILDAWDSHQTAPYAAKSSWKVPRDPEAIRQFIAGGGAINLGILWYSGIVPRNRVVTRFNSNARGGGHAISILGYEPDRFTILNSHGDGLFYVMDDAMMQMLNHSWTAAVGVLGSVEPTPVDWVDDSPLF